MRKIIFLFSILFLSSAFFPTPTLARDKNKVKKSIEIDASIEEVFSYATNPENLLILMPNMKSVTDVSPPTPGAGQSWHWKYEWMGATFKGKSRVVEFNPPTRYVVQSGEKSPDLWTYTLSNGDMGTKVTLEIEYKISSSFLTKIANWVLIKRKIRGEVQDSLERLKAITESDRLVGENSHLRLK